MNWLYDVCIKLEYVICVGIPEFIPEPPMEVEVHENLPFVLRIEMEGNPKPKAYFKWTHLSSLSEVNASSYHSNTFLYYATYKMNHVDASFCGERLQTTLQNNLGSSTTKHIRVIVLCKLLSLISYSLIGIQDSPIYCIYIDTLKCNQFTRQKTV